MGSTFKDKKGKPLRCSPTIIAICGTILVIALAAYCTYFRNFLVVILPKEQFINKLKEVCANSKHQAPEYKGVETFFEFLKSPDSELCYSWVEFGGEKLVIPTQKENQCMDETRKNKYICFNEEYKMTHDPCLVYSFTKDADQQFERDMHMFSCETHAFDAEQIKQGEHVRRTEFWAEHAWDISEYSYDIPASNNTKYFDGIIRRRSLDFILDSLQHRGKIINYLKSDTEGREWALLKQIIVNHDQVDIQQIGSRVHLPVSAHHMTGTKRHEYFRKLYQIFEGLTCMGYKMILLRPIQYYRGIIHIPELDTNFHPAFEVNFAKVMK